MRLHCTECGKSVSTEVAEETVVRAILTCPECVPKIVATDRANALRDAVCAILSSTGAYPHDIPRLAKEALTRDNELLDAVSK